MSSENLPEKVEPNELATTGQPHPLDLIRQAIESGIDAESMSILCDLAHKQEDRNSAREFADGMVRFQDECPPIPKSSVAEIATRGGSNYSYSFAKLEAIDKVVRPILHRLGFSFSWNSKVEGGLMIVTCVLKHLNGHMEESVFAVPTDSPNKAMSGPQKFASAMTFARRHTLTAILGLTTVDPDDDGADPTPLNLAQAATIEEMLDAWCEAKGRDRATEEEKLLRYLGADSVEQVLASKYPEAISVLSLKGGGQ